MDKNGRMTTVHKRAEAEFKASALSALQPKLPATQNPTSAQQVIKLKKLAGKSDAARIAGLFFVSPSDFTGTSVSMDDSELYEALGNKFSSQDAAHLKNMGISIDMIKETFANNHYEGRGTLGNVITKYEIHHRENDQVLDRLQELGVPALVAEKVISNGLENAHLNQALNEDQLVTLFSKYKFRGTFNKYGYGHNEQNDVLMGFVSGDIPFELFDRKISDLTYFARDIYDLKKKDHGPIILRHDPELAARISDHEYLLKLADKALSDPVRYKLLKDLDAAVQKHGPEALELNDPRMAAMGIFVSAGVSRECGVEAAKYVERVLELAKEETVPDFWGTNREPWKSGGVVKTTGDAYLRNYELLSLYEAGVPADECYDLLVKHKLSHDQILVAKETGVATSIADGVL